MNMHQKIIFKRKMDQCYMIGRDLSLNNTLRLYCEDVAKCKACVSGAIVYTKDSKFFFMSGSIKPETGRKKV